MILPFAAERHCETFQQGGQPPDPAGPEQNAGSKYSAPEQTSRRRHQPQARFRYVGHTRGTRM